jgi:hypothetical protein
MDHIQVATNLTGPVRREMYMGREHVVVSAVLVRSKVLHNNLGRTYLPPEDITPEWAEQWNGSPVVVDHPRTSARTPDVMNALGGGFIYRARAQNGALKADVFLDPARAADVEDLGVVLQKIEAGDKVEGSTGFPVNVVQGAGVVNGQEYDSVIHPAGADHYAVFAEQIGACSVDDGCGLLQNAEAGCGCGKPDGAVVELPPATEPAALARDSAWRAWLQKAARLLGFRPADNQTDEDRRQVLRSALVERFGADDRYLWVDSVSSEEGWLVFEVESRNGGESGLFQVDFNIDDGSVTLGEPVQVRRVTAFEPVANAEGEPTPEEGSTMNREQMIAQLAQAGPLDKEALGKLSDCQLKALAGAGASSEPQPEPTPEIAELQRRIVELRTEKDRLDAETKNAREAEMKERLNLQEELIYNGQTDFGDDQIRQMDIRMLRQLHRTVFAKRADFGGRGGPAASSGASFDFVQGIMDAPAGKSVLDRKESN